MSEPSFLIKNYMLPHDARISNGGTLRPGTKIWCIEYGTLIFEYAFRSEREANKSLRHMKRAGNPIEQSSWKDRIPNKVL